MVTKGIQTLNKELRRAVDHARRMREKPADVCATLMTFGIVIGLQSNINVRELFEQLFQLAAKDFSHHD